MTREKINQPNEKEDIIEKPGKLEKVLLGSLEWMIDKTSALENKLREMREESERKARGEEKRIDKAIKDNDIENSEGALLAKEKIRNIEMEKRTIIDETEEKVIAEKNIDAKIGKRSKMGLTEDDRRTMRERREREINEPLIQEARERRNQLLEKRGLFQLSRNDFKRYFASEEFEVHADLKQQNVGDCYAVAAIHAMSCSPHFEMIVRSSMKRLPDGSWEVKMPLLSENSQVITIAPEDILPQENRQFLERKKEGGKDRRERLLPVEGKEGLQILEAAFIKHKFKDVDRLAAEGGCGTDFLLRLGGDNFLGYKINSSRFNHKKGKWEYPGLGSLSQENMSYLDNYLENFDPEVYIAIAATKPPDGIVSTSFGFYKGKKTMKFFVPGHGYSISKVDPKEKKVTLANPWDTSRPIDLTFEQFKGTFSGLHAIRVNSANLLKNMETVPEKAI